MMLRSSSTPLLGSLISSVSSESLNNHQYHHDTILHHPYKSSPIHKSQHFTTISCSSSPMSPSFGNDGGIRRAQSEGNLDSLIISSMHGYSNSNDDHDFTFFHAPKKHNSSSRLHSSTMLETIPSFSYHNSRFKSDGDETSDDEEEIEKDDDDEGSCEFSGFNIENKVLSLNKQMGYENSVIKDNVGENGSQMYLAKGLGVDAGFGCGDGGGRNLSHVGPGEGGGGGGDGHDTEEYYRKMVVENPGNALFLGNYARYLYQSKQDLQGAEEYYSRAILVDPNDGEILSQYAKLLWESHHDKDRATSYFERAVQAASEDSHVHAAYASFLWDVEGDEDEEEEEYCSHIPPLFKNGTMASAATA